MSGHSRQENLGLWLGVLGVTIFAMTVPMTRLATGTTALPQLSPWFVTFGRALLAAVLSALFLLLTRSPWPRHAQLRPLLLASLGNCVGFPLMLGLALRHVTASHAAVIMALLPLATAAMAAWLMHQRAHWGFWACAALGALLVLVFAVYRAQQLGQGWTPEWADLLLLGAVLSASLGYVAGARITPELGAERVICWVCIMALPVSLPGALLTQPTHGIAWSSWAAFAYVGMFSMWAGFFAWYRGLVMGGAMRVSQTQLLQPFLTILFAIPVLGEPLDPVALGFAAAVIATVFVSRKMNVTVKVKP